MQGIVQRCLHGFLHGVGLFRHALLLLFLAHTFPCDFLFVLLPLVLFFLVLVFLVQLVQLLCVKGSKSVGFGCKTVFLRFQLVVMV